MLSILTTPPKMQLDEWASLLSFANILNVNDIRDIARKTVSHLQGSASKRLRTELSQKLEQRWYASLDIGMPDYSVYDESEYLAELWACWAVYSRRYLLSINSSRSLPPTGVISSLGSIKNVADLGCGFGYTSAGLKEILPQSNIIGTNIEDTVQMRLARLVGQHYGFTVVSELEKVGKVDLVFASEYFEHIFNPVSHLRDIMTYLRPKAFLIASTFGPKSIGHFNRYEIDGQEYYPKTASRLFDFEMRKYGFEKVKTRLWNNRPVYWKFQRDLPTQMYLEV